MRRLVFIVCLGLIITNLSLLGHDEKAEVKRSEKISKMDIAKVGGSFLISAYCAYFIFSWPHAQAWDKANSGSIKKAFPLKYTPCAPFVKLAETIGGLFTKDLRLETSLLYTIPAIVGWKSSEYCVTKLYKILKSRKADER